MGRTVKVIPQEVQDQMFRDYRRGVSVRSIAAIYGIGINKTYDIIKTQFDITVGRPKRTLDFAMKSMMEDYNNGLSIIKIAKKYGCTNVHVYRLFKQNNFDIHDGKPKRKLAVIEALELGEMTQSQIARECGVSRQFVQQVKKELEGKKDADLAL